MLETYDLTDNPWLHEMFDVKEKWCMVYGRPFAPFIRVNHHKQSIVFGAAYFMMKL